MVCGPVKNIKTAQAQTPDAVSGFFVWNLDSTVDKNLTWPGVDLVNQAWTYSSASSLLLVGLYVAGCQTYDVTASGLFHRDSHWHDALDGSSGALRRRQSVANYGKRW